MEESNAVEKLECSEIVHRLVLRKDQIDPDTGDILSGTFILRPPETGLSVDIARLRDIEESVASFNKVRAVGSLHVGRIRDTKLPPPRAHELELDVQHTPQDATPKRKANPAHAEIIGLPKYEGNEADAEFLAGELANQCRKVWNGSL